MAFDVQTLAELAKCGDCLSPNQKQNVLLYLLNGILENGAGGGGLHNLLSLTHPDTVPGPPTRGAIVVGNATPDWEALPIGAANRVLRSDGVDATWSQLVLTTDVTGILPIANGGTNSSAALNNNRIMVSSGGAIVEAAALTNGQLLIGSTGAAPVAAGLTAGTNVTIGTGAGSITINAVMPGGFTGFDNPTASVGLVAVNGVATTAMRSDAAPPLDQSIAPTWTGLHIFAPTTAPAIQINPFGVAAGNTSELRFRELAASGTNYTGFKAADAMAASEIYVLPDAAPSANRFLRAGAVVAGVSTLSWTQISLTADVTGILPVANGGTGTGTAFTQGSVIFAGAAGVYTQDNANFFFDNTNNRLGLVTAVPLYTLHVLGPGSFQYGFAAGALVLGADLNATTITVNSRKIGRVNMVSYDGGATNTFLFGGDFTTGANDIYFGGVTAGSQYAATAIHFFTGATQTTTGGVEKFTVNASGVQLPPTGAAAGNTGELRFLELAASGTNYTGFRAADAMAASEIYVLPNAAPAANRFLQAAAVAGGVSALSWAQVSLTADVTGTLPVTNGGTGTATAFTPGSVIFAGASGVYAQDNAEFFWDNSGKRLGIGTTTMGAKLKVQSTVTSTLPQYGAIYELDFTLSSGSVGESVASFGVVRFRGTGGNSSSRGLSAIYGGAFCYNTGTTSDMQSFYTETFNLGAGTVTNLSGARYSQILNLGGGVITNAFGVRIDNQNAGTNNYGLYCNVTVAATSWNLYAVGTAQNYFEGALGVGVITPLAKFHVTNSAAATVGVIVKAAAAQSANLTEWQDSSAVILSKVNSAGNVGVRMAATTLTAYLHIAAGTTAASTGPLKFTSGTSMTTAEAGAMEFTTDDLFFTITTGAARKRLLMADATAGLTSGKIPVATTNGRLVDLTASAAYTPTNVTTDRSYDADTVLIAELADVVGTMIADLQAKGILG